MKILKLLPFYTIALLICGSCNVRTENDMSSIDFLQDDKQSIDIFHKSFEGSINGEFSFVMGLDRDSTGKIVGVIVYKIQGIPYKIEGTMNDKGFFVLEEQGDLFYAEDGGIFSGQLVNNQIRGQWTRVIDGKEDVKFPFSAELSNNQAVDFLSENTFTSTIEEDWTGEYVDKFGRFLKISDHLEGGVVLFEFSDQSKSCIAKVYKDTAYTIRASVANYSPLNDDCHINFTCNNSEHIQVTQYDCRHTGNCISRNGLYVRYK